MGLEDTPQPPPQPSSGRSRIEMDRELEEMLKEAAKQKLAEQANAGTTPPPTFKPVFNIRNLGDY